MITTKNTQDNYSPKCSIGDGIETDTDVLTMKNRRKDKHQILNSIWFVSLKDYENLHTQKYNVAQLKDLCSYYKVKKTGKKSDLISRLYSFLKKSNEALKIQNCFRRHLRKIYNITGGPGLRDRKACRNDTDFYTLEEITKIPDAQFYSIQDNKGNIFGFDIMSIYQLIQSCSRGRGDDKPILNPYTREHLNTGDVITVNIRIRLSNLLKIPVTVKPKQEVIEDTKQAEMECIEVFQIINDLGNYADSCWFDALDKPKLLHFLRELYDIWNYRAQISEETKRDIVNPRGNPFGTIYSTSAQSDYDVIKKNAILVIKNLVTKGIDREHCSLGALYVLSALTLVSEEAQQSIPWLYYSVM